jgi:signal transduction histidine kinase
LLDTLTSLSRIALNEEKLHKLMGLLQKMASDLETQQRQSSSEMREEQKRLTNTLKQQGIANNAELARQLARMELGGYLDDVLSLTATCDRDDVLSVLTHCHRIFRSLGDIRVSVDILMHDVLALKSYAHPGQAEPETLDVHQTLDVALTILKNQLKHRFQVECHYGNLPTITGYAGELSHVWINIIHNAIQAIEEEGRIVIETSSTSTGVSIKITDNGPGIAPDIQDKIFDDHFTTKAQGEGTGLGLALVTQIIAKHHGTINVNSTPGHTYFEVHLPLDTSSEHS